MLAGGGWRQSQVIHGFDSIFAPVWVSINRTGGPNYSSRSFYCRFTWCITGLDGLWREFEFQGVVIVPLIAGVACMGALFRWLPRPMWVYVLGHEFTHALATMVCGGRVKGMKVTGEGGHVYVTKDNFFVTLAPYFVPLYAVLVFAFFALGRVFLGWDTPWAWGIFHWALGLAYSFHVLLTVEILRTRQPDITSQVDVSQRLSFYWEYVSSDGRLVVGNG